MSSAAPSPQSQTQQRQRDASDPRASVWVSANAGSGKTEVLARRVIRLMLDGVTPDELLCLTYTKAAAAEMTNRVFERLGAWITLGDEELRGRVHELTGAAPSRELLVRARRLFADALETPGGLKIQTIHAFCERLLHLFPFDAKTPAHFEVLDDVAQSQLIDAAIASVVAGQDGPEAATAFARVAEDFPKQDDFRDVLKKMLVLRSDISDGVAPTDPLDQLAKALRISLEDSVDDAIARHFASAFWADHWNRVAAALRGHPGATNDGTADALEQVARETDPAMKLAALRGVFLGSSGAELKPNSVMTAKARGANPGAAEKLDDEAARFSALLERIAAIEALARNRAMFTVADAILAHYRAAKARRGALDFADLIDKTRALLANEGVGPWILYKLDSRLTHILVDEAQDTSEAQWDIVVRLAEEFTTGEGARETRRTIFAVGDEKQSIYGFQGAAPKSFAMMRDLFKRRHEAAERRFENIPLTVSFRSTIEVLSAVDRIFTGGDRARGLSFDAGVAPTHQSNRLDRADIGFVELWPLITKTDEAEPDDYLDPDESSRPVDAPSADSPTARLARRVADQTRLLIANGDPTGRPVKPGDVMILVRRRNALFETIISALKQAGVPVAGADRLKVAQHIAVQDCLALARATLMRDDDYALACALKSPLLGLDDDDLIAVAPERGDAPLADALRDASDRKIAAAAAFIEGWRGRATLGPFAFFARLLEAEGGRLKLLARLGAEAGDALDEFLARALDFERRDSASLAAFVAAFENADIEIKRDLAQAANEVRVMTVHAAKGLEAPIVILPDTTGKPEGRGASPALRVPLGGESQPLGVWAPPGRAPAAIDAARRAASADAEDEHRRLLYVALTRARNGLIIAGATGLKQAPPASWYAQISSALEEGDAKLGAKLEQTPARGGEGEVGRWIIAGRESTAMTRQAERATLPTATRLPSWTREQASPEAVWTPPLSPSRAAEAADRRDRPLDRPEAAAARARGRLIHRLLEAIPSADPDQRESVALRLAELSAQPADLAERQQLARKALEIVADSRFADLFDPGSRAEVAVAGPIKGRDGAVRHASGKIDRLALAGGDVLIGDYKTGARPPAHEADIPKSVIAQLAVYRALVAPLYPDRKVRCVVIWTAGPLAHEISNAALDEALHRI